MIFVSSSAITHDNIEVVLTALTGAGIQNIELSGGTKYRPDIEHLICHYQQRLGVKFLLHNYFPPPEKDFVLNIASPDPFQRKSSVEFVKKNIHFSALLGLDTYTIHAGYGQIFLPPADDDKFVPADASVSDAKESLENMYTSLDELKPFAMASNVKIGVENLFPSSQEKNSSLLCRSKEIFSFLDRTGGKAYLGLLLDLGHIVISSNRYGFDKDDFLNELIQQYGHKLFGVHLSGNNGREDSHCVLKPGDWQISAASRIASALKGIPVTIECRKLEPETIVQQFEMVNNAIYKG